MKTTQTTISIALALGAAPTTLSIPAGLKDAHGTGLDGVKRVESLKFGTVDGAPSGKTGIQDQFGNPMLADADEVFALAVHLGRERGYEVTARKIS